MRPSHLPLEALLRRPEPDLPDEGFSHRVTARVPAANRRVARARQWSLAIGVMAGAAVTAAFAVPLESAFRLFTWGGSATASIVGTLLLACIVLPTTWALRSR